MFLRYIKNNFNKKKKKLSFDEITNPLKSQPVI